MMCDITSNRNNKTNKMPTNNHPNSGQNGNNSTRRSYSKSKSKSRSKTATLTMLPVQLVWLACWVLPTVQ